MDLSKIHKMYTLEGFIEVFKEETKNHRMGWQAFNHMNDEFERIFGKRRYKNWKSFNEMWNRKIREGKLSRDWSGWS